MGVNTHDEGAQTCGLHLLIKDHKMWSPDDETFPPSRPVVSGNEGLNMHLSELVSKILEPIAEESGKFEVNSTSHMLNRIDGLNKQLATDLVELETCEHSSPDLSSGLSEKFGSPATIIHKKEERKMASLSST